MRALATALLLLALSSPAPPAAADPLALRHGGPERGLVVEGGWPTVSAGWWVGPGLGLAVDWRLPAGAIGASLGTRTTVSNGPRHGGVDLFGAGGALVPLVDPGLALTATPAVQAGKRGPTTHVTIGLAAPVELLLVPRAQLRLPVLLELRFGGKLGPLWLGLRGGIGPVLTAPGDPGFALQWSLWLRAPSSADDPPA